MTTKSEKACRAIRAATKESEVITAVKEYLDSLDGADTARLPAEILALGLHSAEEVIHSALAALHAGVRGEGGPNAGAVNDAVLVFTTAARRLATLAENTA